MVKKVCILTREARNFTFCLLIEWGQILCFKSIKFVLVKRNSPTYSPRQSKVNSEPTKDGSGHSSSHVKKASDVIGSDEKSSDMIGSDEDNEEEKGEDDEEEDEEEDDVTDSDDKNDDVTGARKSINIPDDETKWAKVRLTNSRILKSLQKA